MTQDQSLALIRSALDKVSPGAGKAITLQTDLLADKVVDSLDLMNFLFHLEKQLGRKIDAIGEDYEDFSVRALSDILQRY